MSECLVVEQCSCEFNTQMSEEEKIELRKQLMSGYMEMAMLNKQMANESIVVENEAMDITNKFLD